MSIEAATDRGRSDTIRGPRGLIRVPTTITSFVRSTRLWSRLFHGTASVVSHAVVLGLALLVIDFYRPDWGRPAAWVTLAWLLVMVAFHFLRRGPSVRVTDQTFELADRLVTWWGIRDRRADAMTVWLERDLAARLAALPPARRSILWRRQARRLWWLLPILLLVYAIGPFGQHLLMSSTGGDTVASDRGPGHSSEQGASDASGAEGTEDGEEPDGESPQPQSQSDGPQPDESPPDEPPPEQPPPEQPREIPALPPADEFVIPRFLGEATGPKQRMKVAVTERAAANAPSPSPKVRRAAGGPVSPDPTPEFRAAVERALRARHVPPAERPFVKRYFEQLLEGRR